jgi:CRISPR-associated protein Cst2
MKRVWIFSYSIPSSTALPHTHFGEGITELSRINKNDLPGNEFWLGGEIARNMPADERQRLVGEGVMFYDNPQKLLTDISEAFVKIEGS